MHTLPHDDARPTDPTVSAQDSAADTSGDDLSTAVAVVGMGCVLPKANNVQEFWEVLKNGVDCITEVPRDRWDPDLFWHPGGDGDKSYTKIGAFITDFSFDSIEFRIPPKAAEALDPLQKMTLVATREAFMDAGLLDARLKEVRPFDRDSTAVVLGNSMGGEVQREYTKRVAWPLMKKSLQQTQAFSALAAPRQEALLEEYRQAWVKSLPPITEDSMPGELSNIVSGRVANVFDLRGKNHTTDAACASSFAALDIAIKSLISGDCDMVVTGGADRSMDIDTFVKFCKIGALSANGSTPFDARADGFVMGEGCAVFILKRLKDALRDGDKVHAVLRGIGSSSDGRGKGITAPNKRGQVLAVERGVARSGVPLGTIQYMEAHGTSTRVGDVVEVEALSEAVAPASPAAGSIGLGSVKSQVGHLKSAAGAVSLLKTVLAFEHQTIPPSINFQTPNPNIDWQRVPFRVVAKAEPWPANQEGVPRRAGISSFGFGGTNFHVVLEEYLPEYHSKALKEASQEREPHQEVEGSPVRSRSSSDQEAPIVTAQRTRRTSTPTSAQDGTQGGHLTQDEIKTRLALRAHLEGEPLVLGARDPQGLVGKLEEVARSFPESSFLQTGQGPRMKDLVYPYNMDGVKAQKRVALVAKDPVEVREKAEFALTCLQDERRMRMAPVKGVFFGEGDPKGKVAFLFPGQGSQYAEMLLDLHEKFAVVRDTFAEADDILEPFLGLRLTSLVFPEHDRSDEEARKQALARSEEALKRTEICQPAVLTVDIALWRLLRSVGIEPDVVAGHSLGEYAALVAAGILRFEDALIAVSARGKEMANVDVPDHGKMASITADPQTIQAVLDQIEEYVIMANKNCPSMTVIAGSSVGVDKAVQAFQAKGIQATYIPVSAAFHSQIVAPASEPLSRLLKRLSVRRPRIPIYANVTGSRYEVQDDPAAFHEYAVDLLSKQIASPVEWTRTIENMRADGVHYFLEVGPKRALTAFVQDILKGQQVVATATNHPKKGGVYHFNETYAVMGAEGLIPKVKHPLAMAHYTQEHLDPLGAHTIQPMPEATQPAGSDSSAQASPSAGVAAGNGGVTTQGKVEDPLAKAFTTDELRTLAREQGFVSYARAQAPVVSAMLRAGWESARRSGHLPADEQGFEDLEEHGPVPTNGTLPPGFQYDTGDIVVSGASVGLPGRGRDFFDDANAESILNGENRIDPLTPQERAWMTDKNIVRLKKGGDGSAEFEQIDDESKVIKLAGVPGRVDLVKDFGVDPKFKEALDITSELAIGAAIDALRDAGIPLVRNYQRTSTGSHLPGDWVLPKDLQDDTGVIFASAWPGLNNLVDELTRFLTQKQKGSTKETIERMLERIALIVPDEGQRRSLVDWIRQETAGLTTVKQEERYEFNRRFVFRILAMGHSQVAQLIKAKGPNTQVNAACSSTTLAVAIAEDWVRTGRARRVIVVGADAPTASPLFEWLSAGFLAAGAATTKGEIEEAALPFDRRRHGMINGCGAVGLVIERREDVKERGMDGLVRILATQVANSGYHASRLDVDHVASQLQKVVELAERRYGLDRAELAKDLVFMSHETYTPARGGSASAEIKSLRQAFGDHANEVLVTNTKGFTGHPHAASIEDAIAVKMLQLGRVPPIPNLKERDPELGDLNLSTGGETDRRYTLRLAAGFGSQITLWVGECLTRGTERVLDETRHKAWLRSISGQESPELEVVQRRLRIKDQGPPPRALPAQGAPVKTPVPMTPSTPAPAPAPTPSPAPAPTPAPQPSLPTPSAPTASTSGVPAPAQAGDGGTTGKTVERSQVVKTIVEMIVEQTGYPEDMLEPDLDLEADLGIDTVKQAELFGLLREKYELPREEGIQIKDYPTLNHIADYITSRISGQATTATSAPIGEVTSPAVSSASSSVEPSAPAEQSSPVTPPSTSPGLPSTGPPESAQGPPSPNRQETPAPGASAPKTGADRDEVLGELVDLVAEQTGYPQDMLEPELDLEADLGIDTVKQAELFGIVREKYALPAEEGIQIKDYPTLNHIADYVTSRFEGASSPSSPTAPAQQDQSDEGAAGQEEPVTGTPGTAPIPGASATQGQGTNEAPPSRTSSTPVTPKAQTSVAPAGLGGLDDLDDGAPSFSVGGTPKEPTKTQGPNQGKGVEPAKTPQLDLGDGAPSGTTATASAPATPSQAPAVSEPAKSSEPTESTLTPEVESVGPSNDDGGGPLGDSTTAPVSQQAPEGDPDAMKHAQDHAQVVKRVTALVADQTGYPEDMLEPDLDLEADLGIDTVKQAELFGLVRELYGLPLPEELKIADYPTISRVADFVVETAGEGQTHAAASQQGGTDEGPDDGLDDGAVGGAGPVKSPVVTQTGSTSGQPESVPTPAPEAEGASRDDMSGPATPAADAQSIPASVDAPTGATSSPAPVDSSIQTSAVAGTPTQPASSLHKIERFVAVPVDAPLGETRERPHGIQGVLLITQDRMGWAERFAERFNEAGITVALMGHTQPHDNVPGYFLPTELSDPASVEQTVRVARERIGPVGGVLHLAGLVDQKGPEHPVEFRTRCRESVRSLFVLARAVREDLQERPGSPIVALTRMGGTFGLSEVDGRLEGAAMDPVQGGVAGLVKSLAKELPECFVRAVDLGEEVGPQEAVRLTLQELTASTTRTEVGHPALDRRIEIEVVPRETLRAEAHPVFPDDHIVVSGGAQGVTAACITALVETVGQERAPALTLLGRTRIPDNIEELAGLSEAELAARKKALLESMRQEHERVTPVMLEREWSRTEKALEVHRTVERLRSLGARVEYLPVDIQDHEAVASALVAAREHLGPVTGVLHGAGLEVSKQLQDKDVEQFDKVFDTKALGLMNLVWATREDPVRNLCVFSSVAGRFGNLGQVDYSAANDLAVRLVMDAGRVPGVRGFAIDWSAWDEVGMATKGGIMQVMRAAGVTPIPVTEGASMFVREWLTGDHHTEVIVAGRLGQIDRDHQVMQEALPPVAPRVDLRGVDALPLVDSFMSHVPGRYAVASRRLLLERDLYLEDHRVDSVAYLPGVFGVEMFAQAAQCLLTPEEQEEGFTFIEAQDIEYRIPVKLLRDRPVDARVVVERLTPLPEPVEPVATTVSDGSDAELLGGAVEEPPRSLEPVRVRCRLETDFVNDAGRVLGDARVHFSGTVVLGEPEAHPVNKDLPVSPGEPAVAFDRSDVYDHFFHGPTFQVLDSVARVEGDEAVAVARFEHDGLFADAPRPRFVSSPLLREAMFQACGFWAMAQRDEMSLPAGIRRVTHHTQPAEAPPGTSLIVVARHEGEVDELHSEYTVEAYTPEGLLVDRMEGFRMVRTGSHKIENRRDGGDSHQNDRLVGDDGADGADELDAGVDAAGATKKGAQGVGPRSGNDGDSRHGGFEVVDEDSDWELEVRDPSGKNVGAAGLVRLGDHDVVRFGTQEVAGWLDEPGFMERWFHPEESQRLDGMRVPKRRVEHAAGVLAAKHAVARALKGQGHKVSPRDVLVRPEPGTRAPTWCVPGQDALPDLSLSVSHSGPHAVALAAPGDEALGLGLDVEAVVSRPGSMESVAFTPKEVLWLNENKDARENRLAYLWTVKEAVLKGLRTGLSLDLRELGVSPSRNEGDFVVELSGAAKDALVRLAGARGGALRLHATAHRFGPGHVAAVARIVRGATDRS